MGEDNNKGGEVRFTVSKQVFSYLNWLAENTVLGRSHNEVAQYLLTERLRAMRDESVQDRSQRKEGH